MPTSTITSEGQTTIPDEVREALDLQPGDKLNWEVSGRRVAITTEEPGLYRWRGFIKHGPDDAVEAVAESRKTRGHV